MTGLMHPSHYIAHRGKMLFLDRVIAGNSKQVTAQTCIQSDHIFFDKELAGVPAWAGLEIMAQTAGIWVGLEDLKKNEPVKLGFLLGSRTYTAEVPLFSEGESLTVKVSVTLAAGNTVVFVGEIRNAQGEVYATGDLTAYRPDDVSAYLKGEIQWQSES